VCYFGEFVQGIHYGCCISYFNDEDNMRHVGNYKFCLKHGYSYDINRYGYIDKIERHFIGIRTLECNILDDSVYYIDRKYDL
jgi:hypothetical protein